MALTVPSYGRFSEDDYRAQAEFRMGLRTFVHVAEQNSRQRGLPPQQYFALLAIRGHPAYPGVSVSEVAQALHIQQSAASLLVDRMVNTELLTRREDSNDRRRMCVALTPRGQVLLDAIMRANRAVLGDVESHPARLPDISHDAAR